MIEGSRGITLGSFRFVAFLVAQFLGAANDNAFKVTLLLLVLATVPDESSQVLYASAAAALFPIPFLLFSPLAGSLADRFRKDRMLLFTKLPEVAAMALAAVGFASGSLTLLFGALFLMATQSAFFSPAKYGILPEIFPNERLSMANGVLELTTNLAILSGSVGGIVVYGYFKDDLVGAGWTYLAIALVGTLAIALSPQAPAGHRGARFVWDLLASARGDWMEARRISVLFYAILGIAWFGFLGSLFLTLVPIFGTNVLGLAEERAGALLAVLSVGVAVGSVGAGTALAGAGRDRPRSARKPRHHRLRVRLRLERHGCRCASPDRNSPASGDRPAAPRRLVGILLRPPQRTPTAAEPGRDERPPDCLR